MTFFILVSVPFGVGRGRLRRVQRPKEVRSHGAPQQRTLLRVQCQLLSEEKG